MTHPKPDNAPTPTGPVLSAEQFNELVQHIGTLDILTQTPGTWDQLLDSHEALRALLAQRDKRMDELDKEREALRSEVNRLQAANNFNRFDMEHPPSYVLTCLYEGEISLAKACEWLRNYGAGESGPIIEGVISSGGWAGKAPRELAQELETAKAEAWKEARRLGEEYGISADYLSALICGVGDKAAEERDALRDGLEKLREECSDKRHWLKHKLETSAVHVPGEQGLYGGKGLGGWCAIQIPDWDVKQKIQSLGDAIAAAQALLAGAANGQTND